MLRNIKRTHFTFPIPKQTRNDVVVGTMAVNEFEQFKANALECPMFIVPVLKAGDSSYFNLVSQFQDGKYCLLTDVEAFRSNPSNASPMMVMAVYDDLAVEKKIALTRGDIVNRLDITRDDARIIMKFLRVFYTHKFDLVKRFNKDPRNFDYNEFMVKYKEFATEYCGVSNSL